MSSPRPDPARPAVPDDRSCPVRPWPGPEPGTLTPGELVVCATTPRPGVVVVRSVGEIDLLSVSGWRRVLDAAVRVTPPPEPPGAAGRLICDLSGVTFLGAGALGVLAELVERAHASGVDLRVVADHCPAARLLTVSGLDRQIPVERCLDHAVGALADDPGPG